MKSGIFTFSLLFLLNIATAQSTDLDQLFFKYAFVQLPSKPLKNEQQRTYTINQNVYHQYRTSHDKVILFDEIKIEGFEKKETGAYLTVEVTLDAPTVLSKENVVRAAKSKNKAGVEVTTNYYTPTWNYRQNGKCLVKDSLNNIISTYSLRAERTFKATELGNKGAAESTLSATFENRIDVGLECVRNAQTLINSSLNKEFGYPLYTGTDYLWILGSSKNPERDAQLQAHKTISVNFEKMQGGSDMKEMAANVQSAITYFEGVDKSFNTDDKKHRKMRYAAYFNLAMIYQYLDMPDKSIEWAKKLIANDFDAKDGEKFVTKAEDIRKAMATNKMDSRHMRVKTVDLPKPVPVEKKAYSLEEDKSYIFGNAIKAGGDTIQGYIRKVHPNQMKATMTIKVKGMNDKWVDKTIYAHEVNTVIFENGDIYKGLFFAEPGKTGSINLDKEAFFVKEIYSGKKLSVYQYLSSEIVIHRAGSKNAEAMGSPGWAISPRKKFLELAKDCPELAKRAEAKEFSTQANSLIDFAKALEVCK